jgi:hypothetical protein
MLRLSSASRAALSRSIGRKVSIARFAAVTSSGVIEARGYMKA